MYMKVYLAFFTYFLFQIFSSALLALDIGSEDVPFMQDNCYVKSLLSESEQELYFKNPVKYMEELAIKNKYRALELSLYYQGWAPELVFFRFNENKLPESLVVLKKSEVSNSAKMKSKELALKWAKIATEDENAISAPIAFCNLANLLYSKNPTHEEIESFRKIYSDFELDLFADSIFVSSGNFSCGGIYAYAFKNGDMGFPLDFQMCERILARSNPMIWRNFYSGFLLPKDRNFAVFLLSKSDYFWDMQELANIYSGTYDSSDANGELAKYWQEKANKAKSKYIGERKLLYKMPSPHSPGFNYLWEKHLKELRQSNPNVAKEDIVKSFNERYNIFKYAAKEKALKVPYFGESEEIVFESPNPDYDRKKAEKILENFIAEGGAVDPITLNFLRDNLLWELGVDEDLIDKFYKNVSGGKFYLAYKKKLADHAN